MKTSQVQAEELGKQNELAEKQVETFANSIEAQVAVQQSKVDQTRALYELKKSQLERLHIRPGIDGILQEAGCGRRRASDAGDGTGESGATDVIEKAALKIARKRRRRIFKSTRRPRSTRA